MNQAWLHNHSVVRLTAACKNFVAVQLAMWRKGGQGRPSQPFTKGRLVTAYERTKNRFPNFQVCLFLNNYSRDMLNTIHELNLNVGYVIKCCKLKHLQSQFQRIRGMPHVWTKPLLAWLFSQLRAQAKRFHTTPMLKWTREMKQYGCGVRNEIDWQGGLPYLHIWLVWYGVICLQDLKLVNHNRPASMVPFHWARSRATVHMAHIWEPWINFRIHTLAGFRRFSNRFLFFFWGGGSTYSI